jgi:hypothetical protein
MHSSEFIGGRMARDILETPGVYVAVAVEVDCSGMEDGCSAEDGCYCSPAGWSVAYRDAPDFSAALVRDVWHYGNERRVTVAPFSEVAAALESEARHGATGATLTARLQYVAAALEELKDDGTSTSWSWHTLTFEGGA